MDKCRIVLITGVMASGKSSVAQALAESYPRSVHLRGDAFRRFVVNGRRDMGASDSALAEEAMQQLQLRYRLAAQTALGYLAAGFTVIYQDVILGDLLSEVLALYGDAPLEVFVLCPRAEVVEARELARAKTGYGAISVADLQLALQDTPAVGHWVDSSDQSVAETVAQLRSLMA